VVRDKQKPIQKPENNMSYTTISIEELNNTLSMIAYLNGKIAERSRASGGGLDGISEDLVHSLSEFFDFESAQPRFTPAKAA
jgi:hypothetical protein